MVALFEPMPPVPSPNDDPVVFQQKWQTWFDWFPSFYAAVQALNPLSEGYDTLMATLNYKGDWPDLSGAVAVGDSLTHEGKFYLVKEAIPNVAIEEPALDNDKYYSSNQAVSVPLAGSRTFTGVMANLDFFVSTDNIKYALSIEKVKHTEATMRAIGMAFATDADAEVYGTPIAISEMYTADTDMGIDVEFFISANSIRTMISSDLGQMGKVIPAAITGIRIGPMVADEFNGDFEPTAGNAYVNLVAIRGN